MITESLCKLNYACDKYINKKYGNFAWLNILIAQNPLAICSAPFKVKLQYFEEKVCLQSINQIKYLDISNLSM